MTFNELAIMVADEFKAMAAENDYNNFAEMKKAEMWSAEDIKDEIGDILDDLEVDAYIDEVDGSLVFLNFDDMKYGQFKRLVMAKLK